MSGVGFVSKSIGINTKYAVQHVGLLCVTVVLSHLDFLTELEGLSKPSFTQIQQVISATDADTAAAINVNETAFTDKGQLVNSGAFNGLSSDAALSAIADKLEPEGKATRKVNGKV